MYILRILLSYTVIYSCYYVLAQKLDSNRGSLSSKGHNNKLLKLQEEYLELFRNVILNRHYEHHGKHVYLYGSEWPEGSSAISMIGSRRLDHLVALVVTVIENDIPGHVIETGVWRGGASFLAAKAIELLGEEGYRHVYMCDSFVGIPLPPAHLKQWKDDLYAHTLTVFNINGSSRVRRDAELFGIDMSHIHIVEGYFNDSLPALIKSQPEISFSILRLDGDTYFSTYDAIDALYPHLSPGGFVIVDDYTDWPGCRDAIDSYRTKHSISDVDEPIIMVPHMEGEIVRGIYWRKKSTAELKQCVGDGISNHDDAGSDEHRMTQAGKLRKGDVGGKRTINRSSLRVRGSYNPSNLVPMPPDGPANMTILGLAGRKNIMMCV